MKRSDCLLAIVLELQRHDWQRAEDLAATFEVSQRTIYRDIQALSEAGVPIVAMTGQGYALAEGYFLPPLNFTVDEALILALGSDFLAQNFDAQYRDAALAAGRKLESALPVETRAEIDRLKTNMTFFAAPALDDTKEQQLQQLRRAIIDQQVVRLHYTKRYFEDGESDFTVRSVNPYSLAWLKNDWFLYGYCHLRAAERVFRLSRIEHLILLRRTFVHPPNFQPQWTEIDHSPYITAHVLFDAAVARWVGESPPFFVTKTEHTAAGFLVSFTLRYEREALQWLLSWGSTIKRVEPGSLHEALLAEIEQMNSNLRGY